MAGMIVEIAVVGLVAYRAWRLLSLDEITQPIRHWLLERSDDREDGFWFRFLYCPWCSGFWITGLITLIAWQTGLTSDPLWVWPAASVIVGWLGGTT